jgi:hypothetical protein
MLQKIEMVENNRSETNPAMVAFILNNRSLIDQLNTLTPEEFDNLNKGKDISRVLAERELINKFG